MMKFCNKNKLFSANYGFAREMSCIDSTNEISEHLSVNWDLKYTKHCFIDLKKAFGILDHGILLANLDYKDFR